MLSKPCNMWVRKHLSWSHCFAIKPYYTFSRMRGRGGQAGLAGIVGARQLAGKDLQARLFSLPVLHRIVQPRHGEFILYLPL